MRVLVLAAAFAAVLAYLVERRRRGTALGSHEPAVSTAAETRPAELATELQHAAHEAVPSEPVGEPSEATHAAATPRAKRAGRKPAASGKTRKQQREGS